MPHCEGAWLLLFSSNLKPAARCYSVHLNINLSFSKGQPVGAYASPTGSKSSYKFQGRDSNPRPLGYEPSEIPLLHPGINLH